MRKFKKAFSGIVVGSALVAPVTSFAAVPAAVTTAISDAGADVATIGGAVLVVMIGIATFIWLRKPMH